MPEEVEVARVEEDWEVLAKIYKGGMRLTPDASDELSSHCRWVTLNDGLLVKFRESRGHEEVRKKKNDWILRNAAFNFRRRSKISACCRVYTVQLRVFDVPENWIQDDRSDRSFEVPLNCEAVVDHSIFCVPLEGLLETSEVSSTRPE